MLVWNNRFDVLVVEAQNSNEHFQDVFNEASMILNENVLKKSSFSYPAEKETRNKIIPFAALSVHNSQKGKTTRKSRM